MKLADPDKPAQLRFPLPWTVNTLTELKGYI